MPGRHALLVGVNHYPYLPQVNQLSNCLRDVGAVEAVLRERLGFTSGDFLFLRDAEATREAVLAGLQALLARARPDDLVVFFFAGHGSQMAASHAWEPDGTSQTIVPCDGRRDGLPSPDIRDDEVHGWLLRIGEVTPNVIIVADTCFSGGMVRTGSSTRTRYVEGLVLPPSERPPSAFSTGVRSFGLRDVGPSGFLPRNGRYVLLAACERGQRAKEHPEEPHGIFSYHLCQTLFQLPPSATYRDLQERVRLAVHSRFRDQSPQIEGGRDRRLFGGEMRVPDPYLLVEARDGNHVTLGGGSILGVQPGSVWSLQPAGATTREEAGELARLRVTTVGAVTAFATLDAAESAPELGPGCRAFEVEKGPGWMTAGIWIEDGGLSSQEGSQALGALREAIEDTPVLRLAANRSEADFVVRVRRPGDRLANSLSAGDAAGWEVVSLADDPVLALQPLKAPKAAEHLAARLGNLAFRNNLQALFPPSTETDRWAGALQVELGRRKEDGSFELVAESPDEGRTVYREGDLLALRIAHTSDVPLHIHVLDVGLTGSRGSLYPVEGHKARLRRGVTLHVGAMGDDPIELSVPEDLPLSAGGGPETVLVFVSEEYADLRVLDSAPLRGSRPVEARSDSLRALAARACGRSVSPLRGNAGPGEDGGAWTVVTRTFWVERKPS